MSRLAPWWLCLTTFCAIAALSRLLGIWCADPTLGTIIAGSAVAMGIILQSWISKPAEEEAVAWLSCAGLLAAFVPVLLRFLGLNTACAAFLEEPLNSAIFVLGQVWLAAAFASAAAARGSRGLSRPATDLGRFAALFAAIAAVQACHHIDPSILLAAAGAAMASAAALITRPWANWRVRPSRMKAYALSTLLALALTARSAGVMRDVWTARLDTLYPGGRFITLIDDGSVVRGVYEFSTKTRTALRDGVLQADDLASKAAVMALRGQKVLMNRVLVVSAPTPAAPIAAAALGLKVSIENGSRIESDVLDILGGENWRRVLAAPSTQEKPEGLVLFLPRPLGLMQTRRLAGGSALRALRSRLTKDACVTIVIPAKTAPAAVADIESSAREVFGAARTADAGRSVLVAACPDFVETTPSVLFARIPFEIQKIAPEGDKALAEDLQWRPGTTTK